MSSKMAIRFALTSAILFFWLAMIFAETIIETDKSGREQ